MSVGTEAPQTERTRVSSGASVRVNLLPQATRDGAKAARQKAIAIGAMGALVLGLGAVTYLQRGWLADAQEELAAAEADRSVAQQQVAELQHWSELASRLDATNATIAGALGDQSSLAGVLQDLALVVPPDGAVTSVTIDLAPATDDSGSARSSGTFSADAETASRHAPGVERFLLQLDRAAGFRQVYPTNSSVDEDGFTTFQVSAELGTEYQTGRYVDGIPEVAR